MGGIQSSELEARHSRREVCKRFPLVPPSVRIVMWELRPLAHPSKTPAVRSIQHIRHRQNRQSRHNHGYRKFRSASLGTPDPFVSIEKTLLVTLQPNGYEL